MNEKQFDERIQTMLRHAVEYGYEAHEHGVSMEEAVQDVLKAAKMGKAIGQHKGRAN